MNRRSALLATGMAIGGAALLWLAADGEAAVGAPWNAAVVWIAERQRLLHRELAEHLRLLKADGGVAAAWGMAAAAFLYGVVHAAGPGHGKAILATYLLTQRERVGRGLVLATVAAYGQGAVAIALIFGLTEMAGWLPRQTSAAVAWSERVSFVLIVVVGAWLSVQAIRRLVALVQGDRGHRHDHAAAGSCHHDHGPSARLIDRAQDLRSSLGVIAAIGFRPCSGAILVLALSRGLGLPWAGLASVLAMSTGTAMATAALAMLAVHARQWAARAASGRISARGGAVAANALALTGGVVILLFGSLLLAASFAPRHPLGL